MKRRLAGFAAGFLLGVFCLLPVSSGLAPQPPAKAKSKKAKKKKCPDPCPVEGCGGDAELNRQKNRTGEPAAFRLRNFDYFENLNASAVRKKGRDRWNAEERKRVDGLENGDGVTLVGLLYDATLSDKETCNCSRDEPEFRDYHIWLVRSRERATKPDSIVVEMTPPIRRGKTGWDDAKLRRLIPPRAWTRVRVRGYLFFDSEHFDFPTRQPRRVRASAWEIHPVTEFEVCPAAATCTDGGAPGWVKLENLPAP